MVKLNKFIRPHTARKKINTSFFSFLQNVFDPLYYVDNCPKQIAPGEALDHFLQTQSRYFISPSLLFDLSFYEKVSGQEGTALDLLKHYFEFGAQAGLEPHPLFDSKYYRNQVGTPFRWNALAHYSEYSKLNPERHASPSLFFDAGFYLRSNKDVATAKVNPLLHYLRFGWKEWRDPSPYFNVYWYLHRYKDIYEAAVEPLAHYLEHGRYEGRQPHHLIDTGYYIAGAQDVKSSGIDPLTHYILHGDSEGRSAHPLFDPHHYRVAGPDIGTANPFAHYAEWGGPSLRSPCPAFDAKHYAWHYPNSGKLGQEPLLDYILAPAGWRRHFHPLLDGAVQIATSMRSANGMDALAEYIQFRSNFSQRDRMRGTTGIPSPTKSLSHRHTPAVRAGVREQPKVSIIVPCYNSNLRYLRLCIDSILSQDYSNWELILVDDCSTDTGTWPEVESHTSRDGRVRAYRAPTNFGISGATNFAISKSTGDYIALVDHDDVLVPDAISIMIESLVSEEADAAYSDQAYVTVYDTIDQTFFKPDWSPAFFTGVMYVGHLLVFKKSIGDLAGSFNQEYDGCQDFEYMLRISEVTKRILHVPLILYHWRRAEGSVAADSNAKGRLEIKQALAVNAHFLRVGFNGRAEPNSHAPHRLRIKPSAPRLHTSLDVICSGGEDKASAILQSIKSRSPHTELNTSFIDWRSGLRLAIETGRAPYLLFLGAGFTPKHDDWLSYLTMYAEQNEVAFVAPHLVDPRGVVIAAGWKVDAEKGILPVHAGTQMDQDGYAGSLICDREVSVVSGNFALVRRSVLEALDGLDPNFFSVHGAVCDASFRASLNGFRNISVASHIVSRTDLGAKNTLAETCDIETFSEKHQAILTQGDKYYNKNLGNGRSDYSFG